MRFFNATLEFQRDDLHGVFFAAIFVIDSWNKDFMAHTLFPYSRNGIGSEKRKFVLTIIFASSFRTIDLLDVSNSRKKKEKEIGDEPTKLQSIAKISSSITR